MQKSRFAWKALQLAVALVFALAGALSLFSWRDVVRSNRLSRMDPAHLKPILETPLHPKMSGRWLRVWSDRALDFPSPLMLDKTRQAIRQALQQHPEEPGLWDRLAYLDIIQYGKIMPEGQAALRHSFLLSPYGSVDLMRWRLELANAFWLSLAPDTRQKCLDQIQALARRKTERAWLRRLAEKTGPDILRLAILHELDKGQAK